MPLEKNFEYMLLAWEKAKQLQQEDVIIHSKVLVTNRTGAYVEIEGLSGFIPRSHIYTEGDRKNFHTEEARKDLIGKDLPLKFLEVDEEKNRLLLSHRHALVKLKIKGLEIGQVIRGFVKGIKPYGAFIDIGGASGLLHISEISHQNINTPHNILEVNDELKVIIIDLDKERCQISLSTKQLEPEPGDMVKNRDLVFEKAEEMAEKYRQKLEASLSKA